MRTLLSLGLALCLGCVSTACSGGSSEPASNNQATGTEATGTEVAGSEATGSEATGSEATGTEVAQGTGTAATEGTRTEVGAFCGSRGASPCPAGTFCDYVAGSNCGADDGGGRCEPIPAMCTREFMPVCGCDGQTHPTACTAHAAGVSVAHDGPC